MIYVDTSVLVAGFTHESTTARILAWLGRSRTEGMLISDWVTVEFSAALSLKMRTKQIDENYRQHALILFSQLVKNSVDVTPVNGAHFAKASQFAESHALGVRAGDALHLAIAGAQNATLVTLDKRLARAGPPLGVATRLL
jgi:predicted nucleic acid-binding protein